jgi:hypothetical protein
MFRALSPASRPHRAACIRSLYMNSQTGVIYGTRTVPSSTVCLKVPERFASGSSSTSVASMSGLSGMGTRNSHLCHWNTASQQSARRWTRITTRSVACVEKAHPKSTGECAEVTDMESCARIWRNLRRACGDAGVARPLHFRCNR